MIFKRIEDHEGRQYVFYVNRQHDVASVIASRGELVGFKDRDAVEWESLDGKTSARWSYVSARPPIFVNVDQLTWRSMIEKQLAAYKEIGFRAAPKGRITIPIGFKYKLSEIMENSHGLYVEKILQCHVKTCTNVIHGRQYLAARRTHDDGYEVFNIRNFVPVDGRAVRTRRGGKSWYCHECAPLVLKGSVPAVTEGDMSPVEPKACEPQLEITNKVAEIEALLKPTAEVNEQFAIGANWALNILRPYVQEGA